MSEFYRAAVCTALTGPDSLQIEQQAVQALGADQVRIAVRAAGLNFPDLLMTYGKYQFRPDPPFVPGLEAAGEIIELGESVSGFSIGDRVMTGNKGGALAEQMTVPFASVKSLPEALSFAEGACWQTAASTAWNALIEHGKLSAGETVLVLGASGGVGMAAVKLAKHVGAKVIGTASTTEKRNAILAAGADHALDPKDEDLAKKVKSLTASAGADVVYDPVGGDLAITATRSIAFGGRYLIIGFASGDIPSFPANHALIKAYSLIGIRAGESPRRNPDMAARQSAALSALAREGAIKPHICRSYALDEVRSAFEDLEKRTAIGRIVVEMTPRQ